MLSRQNVGCRDTGDVGSRAWQQYRPTALLFYSAFHTCRNGTASTLPNQPIRHYELGGYGRAMWALTSVRWLSADRYESGSVDMPDLNIMVPYGAIGPSEATSKGTGRCTTSSGHYAPAAARTEKDITRPLEGRLLPLAILAQPQIVPEN